MIKKGREFIYPGLFNMFWELYPRKIRKRASFIVWNKLNRKQKLEVSIASKNYALECEIEKKEKQYILLPTTFLNPKKELWEDYMKPPKIEKTWLENRMEEDAKDKD